MTAAATPPGPGQPTRRPFLPQLRYPRAWFAAGLLLALVITVLSLVPATQLPPFGLSDKIEHAAGYLALAFWFAGVIERRDHRFLALALLAFGGAIEIAQGLMGLGRQADLRDLAADAIGIAGGIALALTPLGGWAGWLERRLAAIRP